MCPGGTYFFTVTLRHRRTGLLVREIAALREAVRAARARHPFHIDAWVVLPDHLHCVWTLPEGDTDYPARWHMIKAGFSRSVPEGARRTSVMTRRGERGIWQARYWEHTVRDAADYAAHMDYVHFNPVKHGLAADAAAWPYSTFRRCVAAGVYSAGWGGAGSVEVEAGEPR